MNGKEPIEVWRAYAIAALSAILSDPERLETVPTPRNLQYVTGLAASIADEMVQREREDKEPTV